MLTTGKKIISLLNPYVKAKFDFVIYKVRYLALYILFGFTSLILEIIIRSFLLNFNYGILFPTIFSSTRAWIDSYCSKIAILSISSIMFSTELIE